MTHPEVSPLDAKLDAARGRADELQRRYDNYLKEKESLEEVPSEKRSDEQVNRLRDLQKRLIPGVVREIEALIDMGRTI